jgi:sucrose-6F-phosphate phosphohydrolase
MNEPRLFLCTDLDRTLLPNGPQPESPRARALFAQLVNRPQVILAYVTGRHRTLVDRAIANYVLPKPNFAITDVGTKIHAREKDHWRLWPDWEQEIERDWAGYDHAAISRLFSDLRPLRLQELAKQNTHKVSYYLPVQVNRVALQTEMQQRMAEKHIRASFVWSVDEPAGVGLLDVVPERATKLHAVEFLRERLGVSREQTLFAGDSGNDLAVMASDIPAVLVANAVQEVRRLALQEARAAGHEDALYLARGGYLSMNGNYSAGILEGVAHFQPALRAWMENG